MFISESFLSKLMIVLAVWVVYSLLVVYVLKAINKRRHAKMQQIRKMRQDAEEHRLKMRVVAEDLERIGRYEEAATLYEESGELEKARQCRMLVDYVCEFNH